MRDNGRIRAVLAVLLLVSLTLTIIDLRSSDGALVKTARSTSANVIAPLQEGIFNLLNPIGEFFTNYGELVNVQERARELEAQNVELLEKLKTSDEARRRAGELDALLDIAGIGSYKIVPAQVIAIGPKQDFSWTITIDVGSNDGITENMTVLNGQGLVGRTTSVTASTANVILLIDKTSRVGSRIAGRGELGFASGEDLPYEIEFELFDPIAKIEINDILVSWGSEDGQPYAAGVPIGRVISVENKPGLLTKSARIKPYVNFSTLDLVGVVIDSPRNDARPIITPTNSDSINVEPEIE
jgi:rod shape-determining protein MreC